MCFSPIMLYYDRIEKKYTIKDSGNCDPHKAIIVPCGRCAQCQKQRKQSYTVRAKAEYQKYGPQRTCMINLTVNDFKVNNDKVNMDKVFPGEELCHEEFQKFMKRLRRKIEKVYGKRKIKYICGAEYGEDNGRPHFHVILYGWKPDDLKPWTSTAKGFKQFRSEFIESCWRNVDFDDEDEVVDEFNIKNPNIKKATGEDYDYLPLGFVTVGEVYDSTVAYVTKYVLKNAEVKKEDYYNPVTGVPCRKPYVVFPHEMLGYEWFLENHRSLLIYGFCSTKYGRCSIPFNWIKKALKDEENISLIYYVTLYKEERDRLNKERVLEECKELGIDVTKQYYLYEYYNELVKKGKEFRKAYEQMKMMLGR